MLAEGVFGVQARTGLDTDGAHGTIDEGKLALLHGTCVGDIDWLTVGTFDALRLGQG